MKPRLKYSFTLLELVVAVAILASGIILVYEGFFVSLSAVSYSTNYINAQRWMGQKLWDVQDRLTRYETLLTQETSGSFFEEGKEFLWNLSYSLIETTEKVDLYKIILGVSWREGARKIKVVRSTYAQYIEDKK